MPNGKMLNWQLNIPLLVVHVSLWSYSNERLTCQQQRASSSQFQGYLSLPSWPVVTPTRITCVSLITTLQSVDGSVDQRKLVRTTFVMFREAIIDDLVLALLREK